ncbi:hypothetical protein Bca101_018849 [Brassica carinata]
MERLRTTASMCIPHIATMRPDDMNRPNPDILFIGLVLNQVSCVVSAAVRGEDGPAELQQKLCQGAVVIVNACDLQELIRHGQLLME